MTSDPPVLDTAPFLVVAALHGVPLRITARSALAAAAAARYWLSLGADSVSWCLREDLRHPRMVLLFTRRAGADVVHATELVAGKPVSSHTATCCGLPLRWDVMRICTSDMAIPCPACRTAVARTVAGTAASSGLLAELDPPENQERRAETWGRLVR